MSEVLLKHSLPAVSDSKAARATLDKLLAECRTPTYGELEDLRAL